MSAKNRVINGDYAGSLVVVGGSSNAGISLGFLKQLRLNSTTVESYEVLGGLFPRMAIKKKSCSKTERKAFWKRMISCIRLSFRLVFERWDEF